MGMGSRKLLQFPPVKGGKTWLELNALLYDTFTTAATAPLTSPRTCEPGPGTVNVLDAGGLFSISGGRLVKGSGTQWTQLNGTSALTRTAGLGIFASVPTFGAGSQYARVATDDSAVATDPRGEVIRVGDVAGTRYVKDIRDPAGIKALDNAFPEPGSIPGVILRSAGDFYVSNGKLYWVNSTAFGSSYVYPVLAFYAGTYEADWFAALPLADYNSAWGGDFTEVSDSGSAPATGTPFTCPANFHAHYEFTYELGNTLSMYQRYTDSSHYGAGLHANPTGGLSLYEWNTDPNGLGNAWGVLSDGVAYEVDIVGNGSSVNVYLDKVLVIEGTATYGTALTGGRVGHDYDTNDIEFEVHPLTLGIADSRIICPQDGDVGTHSPDSIFVFKNLTLGLTAGVSVYKLRNGASGWVHVQFYDDGSFYMRDYTGGSYQGNLITAGPGAISTGDDIVIVMDGSDGEVYVNGSSIGSTSSLPLYGNTEYTPLNWPTDASTDYTAAFPIDLSNLLPSQLVP